MVEVADNRRPGVEVAQEGTRCVGGRYLYVATVKFMMTGRDGIFGVSRPDMVVVSNGRGFIVVVGQ